MNAVNHLVRGTADTGVNPGVTPRRERVRAATEAEILATARALLVEGGPSSVTLREVGRRMGMTASALYRYFDGHAVLLDALLASCYDELTDNVTRSSAVVVDAAMTPAQRAVHDLMRAAQAFRAWSLVNRAEFGLMFGPRDPAGVDSSGLLMPDACLRFENSFSRLFSSGVEPVAGFRVADGLFGGLPQPLDEVFARSWIRLLGTVSVQVFGQVDYIPIPAERLFELEMAQCGHMITEAFEVVSSGVTTPDVNTSH